jgi:FkbM family methyltransferase
MYFFVQNSSMNINRIISKLKASVDLFTGSSRFSYSQFAEDILIDCLFTQTLNNPYPSYLDIGANKPEAGSNTYLFYLKKCYGVCVEPDITLYQKFCAARPKDKVINAGVGIGDVKEAVFYYFPEPYTGWNTFSESEAEQKKNQTGIAYKRDKVVPFVNINDIISGHFDTCPDFVSIDVEGLDFEILKSLDFETYRPAVFCIETMEFNNMKLGKKNTQVEAYLQEKGYAVYADTYVNTIFVRKDLLTV